MLSFGEVLEFLAWKSVGTLILVFSPCFSSSQIWKLSWIFVKVPRTLDSCTKVILDCLEINPLYTVLTAVERVLSFLVLPLTRFFWNSTCFRARWYCTCTSWQTENKWWHLGHRCLLNNWLLSFWRIINFHNDYTSCIPFVNWDASTAHLRSRTLWDARQSRIFSLQFVRSDREILGVRSCTKFLLEFVPASWKVLFHFAIQHVESWTAWLWQFFVQTCLTISKKAHCLATFWLMWVCLFAGL